MMAAAMAEVDSSLSEVVQVSVQYYFTTVDWEKQRQKGLFLVKKERKFRYNDS
jgi:hypothetical protein